MVPESTFSHAKYYLAYVKLLYAVGQWRSGVVAQWHSGAVAQWRSGAVTQ